jgi:hypothetical protein
VSIRNMIVNNKFDKIWEEEIVIYFHTRSGRHLGTTEEDHGNIRIVIVPTEIQLGYFPNTIQKRYNNCSVICFNSNINFVVSFLT